LKDLLHANSGSLFDMTLMDKFYKLEFEDNPQVRKAWYVYCFHFLRQVSNGWNTALSTRNVKNRTSMVNLITVSDEALVRWLMKIIFKELTTLETNNCSNNKPAKITRDTKSKLWMYKLEHQNIRSDKMDKNVVEKWNDIFWEECLQRNNDLFQVVKRVRKNNNKDESYTDLPLPGLDDEVKLYDWQNGNKFVSI
jgi:hypothetical protein